MSKIVKKEKLERDASAARSGEDHPSAAELLAKLLATPPAVLLNEAPEPTAAAQAALRRFAVPAFTWLGLLMAELHASLPVSPREEAMQEGREEEDTATGLRGYLEAFMFSTIPEAIKQLLEAAAFRGKERM